MRMYTVYAHRYMRQTSTTRRLKFVAWHSLDRRGDDAQVERVREEEEIDRGELLEENIGTLPQRELMMIDDDCFNGEV